MLEQSAGWPCVTDITGDRITRVWPKWSGQLLADKKEQLFGGAAATLGYVDEQVPMPVAVVQGGIDTVPTTATIGHRLPTQREIRPRIKSPPTPPPGSTNERTGESPGGERGI